MTPQRGRGRRTGERSDLVEQVQPVHRLVDGAPMSADRSQRLHLLPGDDHPVPGAGQLVELLYHRVRGGQRGRLLEDHRLVESVDGGDLLTGLDPAQQRDRLVPIARGTDTERGVKTRGEVPVSVEAVQAGCRDVSAGEFLACRSFQRPQLVSMIAGGAYRDDVVQAAGGRRDIPSPERGEPDAGVVGPRHRDGRPGVAAVPAQHLRLRLAVGPRLVELAARIGQDVALVLSPRPADHPSVGGPVEGSRVRHEQRDVGVHQRRLARPGTSAEQSRAGCESQVVVPVIAAPVDQLQVPRHPLLPPRRRRDQSEQRFEHVHAVASFRPRNHCSSSASFAVLSTTSTMGVIRYRPADSSVSRPSVTSRCTAPRTSCWLRARL